jgi:hypothetical protein
MNGNSTPYSQWPSGEPPFVPKIWNRFRMDQHNCYAYMLNDLQRRKNGKSQPGVFGKNTINTLNCSETIKGVIADNNGIVKYMTLKKGLKYVPRPNYYKGFLMVSPDMDFHFARQDNRMLAVYSAMLRHGEAALKKLNPDQFMKLMFVYCKAKMPEICKFLPAKTNSNYTSLKAKLRFLYRNSKTWSHKPGASPVSDVDAQGRLIFDPLKADWNFPGGINYSSNCCFFEIPMNRLKPTRSTGGNINANGRSDANLKPLKNVDTTSAQQILDKRVRKILGLK